MRASTKRWLKETAKNAGKAAIEIIIIIIIKRIKGVKLWK